MPYKARTSQEQRESGAHAGRQHHPCTRRPRAQSQERRRGDPARPPDRAHRPVRLRQVLTRLRHDLRRGPAPLRREPVLLRAPVPRTRRQAGRGQHRGAVARHLDRPEDHQPQSALHRRHGDRDPRLHAPALGARGRALLAGHGAADRGADGQPDGRSGDGDGGGHAPAAARPGGARPQGRIPPRTRRTPAPRLHPRQGGRQAVRDRRGPGAQPQGQARDRGGGRSHRRPPGTGTAPRRQLRDRPRDVRRHRLRR